MIVIGIILLIIGFLTHIAIVSAEVVRDATQADREH